MTGLDGARVLVAGATGVIGGQLVEALVNAGARVVPAGRNEQRLAELAEHCGTASQRFDAVDDLSCRAAVDAAATELGGLDLLVVATGVAGFGRAMETGAAVTEELFAVDVLGPIALVRAAGPHLVEGATVVVVSAILADLPTAGMADYSAAKSALATWLEVLRREERRRFRVVDVRPPHLDTGLDTRALAGEPPRLPAPFPAERIVAAVLEAVEGKATEVVWDLKEDRLVVR